MINNKIPLDEDLAKAIRSEKKSPSHECAEQGPRHSDAELYYSQQHSLSELLRSGVGILSTKCLKSLHHMHKWPVILGYYFQKCLGRILLSTGLET